MSERGTLDSLSVQKRKEVDHMPGTRLIKFTDLVHDMHGGMTDSNLMDKYGISEAGIQALRRQVLQAARSRTAEIVENLRSGMTASQLMQRYMVSGEQLQRILERLNERGFLAQEELSRIAKQLETVPGSSGSKRKLPRNYPILPLKVHEEDRPDILGMVVDLTEEGIGVAGLQSEVGVIKTLVIIEDEFGDSQSLKLDAICRWASKVALSGEYLSGYQIVQIDRKGLADLRELIRTGTYQTEGLE